MNTGSNISPLVRSMIALLTLIDSDMDEEHLGRLYEGLYSEMSEAAIHQGADLATELLYLCVALSKYSLKQIYDQHDSITGNFSSVMESFAIWLDVESQERTIHDAIDMENCFIELIQDDAEYNEFD